MKALVIIVTIIGLSAIVGSIIVGKMVFDGKVVDKPYEMGLRYDEMEREKEDLRFEILNRELYTGENVIIFTVSDIRNGYIKDQYVEFFISRPHTSKYDRKYKADLVESGRYKAKVLFPLFGYWDLKIKIKKDEKTVILEKKVYVKART